MNRSRHWVQIGGTPGRVDTESNAYRCAGGEYVLIAANGDNIFRRLRLQGTRAVVDKYVKNELEFIVYEAEAVDPDGSPVFRTRRSHVLDAAKRAPRGKGANSGRGGRH